MTVANEVTYGGGEWERWLAGSRPLLDDFAAARGRFADSVSDSDRFDDQLTSAESLARAASEWRTWGIEHPSPDERVNQHLTGAMDNALEMSTIVLANLPDPDADRNELTDRLAQAMKAHQLHMTLLGALAGPEYMHLPRDFENLPSDPFDEVED